MSFKAFILATLVSLPGQAAEWQEPTGNIPKAWQEFKNFAFRDGPETEAVFVAKGSKILFEHYANGFTKESPHLLWSATKGVTGLIVGIAESEGLLKRSDLVSKHLPSLKTGDLRIDHLLHWSSGIRWAERYEFNPLSSTVLPMLYGEGQVNIPRFVLSGGFSEVPGTKYSYSSGDSNVLMGVLKKLMPGASYDRYPWKKLFEPLGMKKVTWEQDGQGNFVGSSYLYMPAREFAKLGLLLLNHGMWQGQQIVPKEWIEWSLKIAPAFKQTRRFREGGWFSPGAHWWVNSADRERGIESPMSAVPPDTYGAFGHWRQRFFVIPSKQLIVVRYSNDRASAGDDEGFLERLLLAVDRDTRLL